VPDPYRIESEHNSATGQELSVTPHRTLSLEMLYRAVTVQAREHPTLGHTTGCGHWQQGIGQAGGLGQVTTTQVNIFHRFDHLNWVAPQTWATPPCFSPGNCTGATNPPDFMLPLTGQTFFEGPNTIYSASSLRIGGTTQVGCNAAYNPISPSTSGGFDC